MAKDPYETLSVTEAATELGLTPRRVRLLCAEGKFGRKAGAKNWVIFRGELDDFKKLPRPKPGPKPATV